MATEKFFVFNEDGALKRLKGRIVRYLDNEDPTGSDKSAIRTSLEVSPDAAGLVQADVGTAPNEIPVNGMLGDMAYQSSDGVSMGVVEADSLSVGNVGDGYSAVADELVVGDEDGSGGMTIVSDSGNSGSLFFADGTSSSSQRSAGKITYNHSADQLQIGTANTAAVTIDSSQRVGIGTASPKGELMVKGNHYIDYADGGATGGGSLRMSSSAVNGFIASNNYYLSGAYNKFARDGGSSQIQFDTTTGASAGNIIFSTVGSGAADSNVVYGERLRITNTALVMGSGVGIDFGSGASTTLDAYEEGTFTPTIYYQNPTGLSISYTTQTGYYTKIGNTVTVHAKVVWTVTGTPVNDNIGIQSFPFSFAQSELYLLCADSAGVSSVAQAGVSTYYAAALSSSLIGNLADDIGSGSKTMIMSGTYQTNQ